MRLFLLSLCLVLVTSCYDKTEVVFNQSDKSNSEDIALTNDNKMLSSLPFTFGDLNYLYFPIGYSEESFRKGVRLKGSYSGSSGSYKMGYVSGNYLGGMLDNLMIRSKGKQEFKLLTKKTLKIDGVNYLYRLDTIHAKDRFVYRVIENDTSMDNILDENDMAVLYLSTSDGSNFKRLSPSSEHLKDWSVKPISGLMYFRTMVDLNKNGKFDKGDGINLYEYNLLTEDDPILIFNDEVYEELIK